MTSIPHEPVRTRGERTWSSRLLVREMWASLAIVVMWLAVLFDAIFGPDIVTSNGIVGSIGENTTVPSAVPIALFAFLGTWVVAHYGFGRDRGDD